MPVNPYSQKLNDLSHECIALIDELNNKFSSSISIEGNNILKLSMIPMLYAFWERFFVGASTIGLEWTVNSLAKNADAPLKIKTLILINTPNYNSYYDKVNRTNDDKPNKKSKYSNLEDLLEFHSDWVQQKPTLIDDKKYIMTFSNVNEKVLRLHEEILDLGITKSDTDDTVLDISILGEIVGRRNDIAHGSFIDEIGLKSLENYSNFLKKLINSYTLSINRKISSQGNI